MSRASCSGDLTLRKSNDLGSVDVMKVLHVVEALGGGVASAMLDYVRNTEGRYEHHLLYHERTEHDIGVDFSGLFVTSAMLPLNPIGAVAAIRQAYRSVQPDVVHAHSSYAGVYARLAPVPGRAIAYTPHCFPFERRDVSALTRLAYLLVEKALAKRGNAVIAVSPHEEQLGRALPCRSAFYVPNVARVDSGLRGPVTRRAGQLVIATGRASEQKGPGFIAAARQCDRRPGARWSWAGSGSPAAESVLTNAGVKVEGWATRAATHKLLAGASVYVHGAAWEGAPIGLLEAAALGVPIVARRIRALESLGVPTLVNSPADMAREVQSLLEDDAKWDSASRQSLALSAVHTDERQGAALGAAYEAVARAATVRT